MTFLNLKTIKKEDLEKIILTIKVFMNSNKFPSNNPLQEIKFKIQDLSIFKYGVHNSNSGYPGDLTIGLYTFDYKPIIKIMEREGIIEINKKPFFIDWEIKTNLQTIRNKEKEIFNFLNKPQKIYADNRFEIIIRDFLNNKNNIELPLYKSKTYKIPQNMCFKKEIINNIECDCVGRDNAGNILLFVEISNGSIDNKDIQKFYERQKIKSNAIIWFIGSRINENIYIRLSSKGAKITLINQIKSKFPEIALLI